MGVQGFQGVDYSTKDRSSGPVQFEQDPAEADPFGLDQMLSKVGSTLRLCIVKSGAGRQARVSREPDFMPMREVIEVKRSACRYHMPRISYSHAQR